MICPALRPTHGSSDTNVTPVFLPNNYIVDQVPVFASWMHPCSFLVDWESENSIGNEKFVGSTSLKEEETIVITRPNALRAKDPGPGLMILANSGVEIAEKNELVLLWHRGNDVVEILIKFFLNFVRISHSWGIGTYKSGILFAFEGKSEGHKSIIDALWWFVKLAYKR